MDRRQFLKVMGVGTGSLLFHPAFSGPRSGAIKYYQEKGLKVQGG